MSRIALTYNGETHYTKAINQAVLTDRLTEDEASFMFQRQDFELKFNGETYGWLRDIATQGNCQRIEVLIESSYGIIHEGYASPNALVFDHAVCTVVMNCKTDQEIDCVFNGWDKELNLLILPNQIGFKYLLTSTNNYNTDYYTHIGESEIVNPPFGSNWIEVLDVTVPTSPPTEVQVFMRLKVITDCLAGSPVAPVGFGTWTLEENNCDQDGTAIWSRIVPAQVANNTVVSATSESNLPSSAYELGRIPDFADGEDLVIYALEGVTYSYFFPNARTLADCLEFLFTESCEGVTSVVSDYFNINPDGQSEIQAPQHLLLSQITDIKYPEASQPATKMITTLKDVLSDLSALFGDFRWRVLDGVVRIEHISYFEGSIGIDLSSNNNYRKATKKPNEVPKRIEYSCPVQRNVDFVGFSVDFDEACASDDVKSVRTSKMVTDIDFIINAPDSDISNDLILITDARIAEGSYYVNTALGAVSGLFVGNARLGWPFIQRNYRLERMPLLSAVNNGETLTFNSKEEDSEMELFVDTEGLDVNPYSKVATVRGVGVITEVQIPLSHRRPTISLRLNADY